ncbi:hypothetical protein REPUB_Repub14bG0005500 [Reevesia pubescens]
MAFSHNLLHFLIIVSPFLLLCSASRQIPKLKEPSTIQFGPDSPSLLFQPSFPTPTQTQTPTPVGDSVLPNFPFFQGPMLPPPAPLIDPNFKPIFPFPSLPSLPKFPPFPFIPTVPLSSPVTPTPPTILSEVQHNH